MALVGVALGVASPVQAQLQTLWKCDDPEDPFRFVTSPSKKSDPPPCKKWLEIRGPNLTSLFSAVGQRRYRAANEFLSDASEYLPSDYPEAKGGSPVTTSELYNQPQEFGFDVESIQDAPSGSLVLFRGLGGILVETRTSEDQPWSKQILYPSASSGYRLRTANPDAFGGLQPKVLIQAGGGETRG